jgi:ABC-type transporter Mla subunit MlaD
MASIKDVEQLADDLEELVKQLRTELKNGPDFEKLVQLADELSEHADNAAGTFNTVNEALMNRLNELGGSRSTARSGGGGGSQSRQQKASQSA